MYGQRIEDVSRDLKSKYPDLRIVEIPTGIRPAAPRPGIIQITSRDGQVTGVVMPEPLDMPPKVPLASLKGKELTEVVRILRSQYPRREVRPVEEGQVFSVELGSGGITVHYEVVLDQRVVTRIDVGDGEQRILDSQSTTSPVHQNNVNENTRIQPVQTRSKSNQAYEYSPLPPTVDPQFINITPMIGCPRPQEFEGKAIMNQDTGELYKMENGILRPFDMYTYKMHNAPSYTAFSGTDLRNCPVGAPVSRHEPQSQYPPAGKATGPPSAMDPVRYALIHATSKDEKNVLMCLAVRNRGLVLEEYKQNEMAMMWNVKNGVVKNAQTGDMVAHDSMCLAPVLVRHQTAAAVWSFVNAGRQYQHRIVSACNKGLSADMNTKTVSVGNADDRWYVMPVQVVVQQQQKP